MVPTNCKVFATCREEGLAGIINIHLPCKQQVLVWAKYPGPLWLSVAPAVDYRQFHIGTMRQILAVEHVFGSYIRRPGDFSGYNHATGCPSSICHALSNFWQRVPIDAKYAGQEQVIELPMFLA